MTNDISQEDLLFQYIATQHQQLINDIIEQNFYKDSLPTFIPASIEEIQDFWHNFWWELPDDNTLRKGPNKNLFYRVCDMTELDYEESEAF